MNSTTDIELVRQLQAGNEEALRNLIERHRERLYRLAYRLLGDSGAAGDAVQETFIRLWRHARHIDPQQTLSTWLCTVCSRRCYDELRRRRRHYASLAYMPTDAVKPDAMATDELLALLNRTVATLPPKQRVVYQLREIECMTTDEVAAATRMTADQVKANLFVARKNVREKLEQYGIR